MSDILTQQDGPILRITLNRPERGNAVSDEMVAGLTRLINGPKTANVLLRGAGNDCCVGRFGMGERRAKGCLRSAPDMPIQGAVGFARNLHAATFNSSPDIRKNRP